MLATKRHPAVSGASDQTLMERYMNGDSAAFDALFHRYEARVFSFFIKRTRSRSRAEDLYQELFLRIHRARHSFDSRQGFAPWLFQIAHRLLIDDARRAHRTREVSVEESTLGRPGVARDLVAEREEVAQLLASLTEVERFVLVASKGAGVDYPEIAASLGRSVDAVKKTASRAMLRLRATVGQNGQEHE
jgi:RNA polymerase sigma-70 factor (ECF subfamily)